MRASIVLSALALWSVGCSSSDENREDDPHPALDAGVLDGGPVDAGHRPDAASPDSGVPSNLSILSRASTGSHVCSVTRELLNYKPLTWSYTGHALTASGSATWLARVEASTTDGPFTSGPSSFVVSQVDAAGKLGSTTTVPVSDPSLVSKPALVALDGGAFALFWYEAQGPNDEPKMLRWASFDSAGKLSKSPQTLLTESADYLMSLRVERTSGGQLGVLWTTSQISGVSRTQLALFDASGQAIGTPRVLTDKAYYNSELVADEGGFALLYQTRGAGTYPRIELVFARFDADGKPRGEQQTVTSGFALRNINGVGSARSALLRVGDEFLAAWPEGEVGNEDWSAPAGAYRVLRIARLNASGQLLSSALLRDKTDSIDEEEPVLTRFGDSVALSWGRADHIYICAGCVPNHTDELVLLDPKTLTPRSNVVKVSSSQGGLLGKKVVAQGDTLLNTLEITFHVHSEPGFAAFQCVAK